MITNKVPIKPIDDVIVIDMIQKKKNRESEKYKKESDKIDMEIFSQA